MKAGLLKGTRDFGPLECRQRDRIFSVIRKQFERFGFSRIETPAMERLDTLTGKYGEEGDQLLFKILNNGDFLAKVDTDLLATGDSRQLWPQLSRRGLRYDLTVPFARYVVMNHSHLALPFKRYQIQPVWRADKPQKGRYQEFYQCDADVVGSDSLYYEADFIRLFDIVYAELGINVEIHINSRKVLEGIAEVVEVDVPFASITSAVDKMDKIGIEGVKEELTKVGLNTEQISRILELITTSELDVIRSHLLGSETGIRGVQELESIYGLLAGTKLENRLVFNPSLARGLSYYTGAIFEIKALDVTIGSIGGGGRYDDLTGTFGMKGISGVGISFGAERIYDVMKELGLLKQEISALDLLIIGLDEQGLGKAFDLIDDYRKMGLKVDCYPEVVKMKKAMKYADRTGVPYVGIIGEEELLQESIMIKNMTTGDQSMVPYEEVVKNI